MEFLWNLLSGFGGAVLGAFAGVFAERAWQRVESRALVRIQIGYFQNVDGGEGVTMEVENVGWDEIPEYTIELFHPDRGRMSGFQSDGHTAFPQLPRQVNKFQWYTKSKLRTENFEFLKGWFRRVRDTQVDKPVFDGFQLQIVLRNSSYVLFAHAGMGDHLAQQLFVHLTGDRTYERVNDFHYVSKAPWWDEWLRKRRFRKMLLDLEKSRPKSDHAAKTKQDK